MLISQGEIINLVFTPGLSIYVPLRLQEEFLNNKDEILSKSRLSETDFDHLCSLLFEKFIFVRLQEYKRFISQAKHLLREHEKDEDFIALCLLKQCKVWTYETRLFEIGFGISTKELSNMLK